jgi:PadR family transcriptional regulator, regulatory protein AphA
MSDGVLSPTGRLILGMIRIGKRTGYEIKQLVDVSARFFWTTSYGQIYPELKRLEKAGLIAGEAAPTGGRSRTVYSLTPAGEEALDAWLGSGGELVWELRDEGLLKVFFSSGREPEAVLDVLRAARARSEAVTARLRELAPDGLDEPGPGPMMALEFGIAFNQWMADWCRSAEERVAREAGTASRGS